MAANSLLEVCWGVVGPVVLLVLWLALDLTALVVGAGAEGAAACTPLGASFGLSDWLLIGGSVFLAGGLVLAFRELVLHVRGLDPAKVVPCFPVACLRVGLQTMRTVWFALGVAILSSVPEACADARPTWNVAVLYLAFKGLGVLVMAVVQAYRLSRRNA